MRVLLKLSGEALSSKENVFDHEYLENVAKQIKTIIKKGNSVAIVIGGGNICRGREFELMGFDRVQADQIGMIGTVLNCMALANVLNNSKVKAVVMSALQVEGTSPVDVELARQLLDKKTVVLFGGGIGNPYFSTDTACALRAIEINADYIMIAKNGVAGVYDKDPCKNPDAKMLKNLTYQDMLNMNLKVMDSTAASLCRDNKIKAFVFNANGKDNIVKAVEGKIIGTTLKA